MKLLEYQAKELFGRYGLPIRRGVVLSGRERAAAAVEAAGIAYPVVVKAQVPVGGRGKAGGIRFADHGGEVQAVVDELLFSELKGCRVNQLLVAEKAEIAAEWYLAILLDRDLQSPQIVFSARGGVDIEETAAGEPDAIVKVPVNPLVGIADYIVRYLCSRSGVGDDRAQPLREALERLYKLFMGHCCMLAEVNPLGVGPDGSLTAIDGKVEVDDAALFRLPDVRAYRDAVQEHPLVAEARAFRFLYIPMAEDGPVAVMSNGSGMLMSMIDLLSKEGIRVGCALDLGGGATRERIGEAVRIVLSNPSVSVLFLSVFGGITRCDEVADGVRTALERGGEDKRVVIRMEGTNREAGLEIVRATEGVLPVAGIEDGVQAVIKGLKP